MSLGHTCAAAVSDRVLNWHSRLRARSVASPGDIRRTVAHMPRDKPRAGLAGFCSSPSVGRKVHLLSRLFGVQHAPLAGTSRGCCRAVSTPLLTPGLPGCFKRSSRRRGTPALPSHMSHCQRGPGGSWARGEGGGCLLLAVPPAHIQLGIFTAKTLESCTVGWEIGFPQPSVPEHRSPSAASAGLCSPGSLCCCPEPRGRRRGCEKQEFHHQPPGGQGDGHREVLSVGL